MTCCGGHRLSLSSVKLIGLAYSSRYSFTLIRPSVSLSATTRSELGTYTTDGEKGSRRWLGSPG